LQSLQYPAIHLEINFRLCIWDVFFDHVFIVTSFLLSTIMIVFFLFCIFFVIFHLSYYLFL
jgi:hypothetical protein